MLKKHAPLALFTLFVLFAIIPGQLFSEELKTLTYEQANLNKGERLFTQPTPILGWADDTSWYAMKETRLMKTDALSGKETLVLDGAAYAPLIQKGFSLMRPDDRTADFKKFLFVNDGDVYILDVALPNAQPAPLTQTPGEEKTPCFSPDGTQAAWTLDGNLFVCDLKSLKITQLTEDGGEEILNGYASWVYFEEILGRRTAYRAFWWSPDSRKIVFIRFDQSKVPVFPLFNANGIYGQLEKQRYPKPGYPNPEVKLGVADSQAGKVVWIPFQDANEHYLAFPVWNKKSDALFFQWMNRGQDHIKIYRYALADEKLTPVYDEQQKAWVEFFGDDDLVVLDNEEIILRSSISGWYHLWRIGKSVAPKPLTSGEWSVAAIELVSEKNKKIYFTAAKEDSTQNDYYCIPLNGGSPRRLTAEQGVHQVQPSTHGSFFLDRYSSASNPGYFELKNNSGKTLRRLADIASPEFKKYRLGKPELFRIKTSDGFNLPAYWILPPDLDKTKKYPVIINIYGGPGAGSVRDAFSYRALSALYLAQQGVIVFSVDHRGSGHFGKKGMDLMHRNLGKWEMNDYTEAVKFLRSQPFVDPERIGVTGGSYGGYVTALALTCGSEYFKYGVAAFSVTDWALYDSVYTERYMDTPLENPDGYKNFSVLNFIDKYVDGTLLITHGTLDDNVHMQNTIQFIDKVLSAGKTVEFMLYPNERHGYGSKNQISAKQSIDFWMRKFFGKSVSDLK